MKRFSAVALCLIAGLVISVMVAWAGAVFEPRPGTTGWSPMRSRSVRARPVPRPLERYLAKPDQMAWETTSDEITARGWVVEREQFALVPKRTEMASPPTGMFIEVYRAGWPLAALEWSACEELQIYGSTRVVGEPLSVWEFGIGYGRKSSAAAMFGDEWRRLAIRPSGWGVGLVVDIAWWGAVVGLAWIGTGAVRRWRRGRHGLCLACGYPVREVGGRVVGQCPECGAPTGAVA